MRERLQRDQRDAESKSSTMEAVVELPHRPSSSARSTSDSVVAHVSDTPEESHEDNYRSHLKRLFITNTLSGHDLQQTSELSGLAGSRGNERLSKAGNHGRHPGNTSRGLKRTMKKDPKMHEPYMAETP